MNGGKNPFENYSLGQFKCSVAYYSKSIIDPPEKSPDYLSQIVKNCLLHDPDKRPSMSDINEHLDKYKRAQRSSQNSESRANPAMNNLNNFLN